jgi:chromosome segregation protein
MLIIMHQNMVEQFTVLSQQEKLRMVEAAVGLEPYRENVVEAQKKLTRILSQEDSVSKLLESAEQTLNYWREQYDKYQQKKQLLTKRRFLERELAWAEVARREEITNALEADERKERKTLSQIEEESGTTEGQLRSLQGELEKLKTEWETLFTERLNLEREKARNEAAIPIYEQMLNEIATAGNPSISESQTHFKLLRRENLKELIQDSSQQLSKLNPEINENQLRTRNMEEIREKVGSQVLESRISLALLQYRKENARTALERLEGELKSAKSHLDEALGKAEETGPRIAVIKNVGEILDELRVIDGHLAALADVSEDIERQYESYSKLYLELKEKAQQVADNREKALEEVKTRMQNWRTVIQSLLDRVSLEYQKVLAQTQALGEVGLVNGHDIETAGLEILVGFKGGKPVALDAYTQSGGERTTATMSFLLALQQHVRSPFRAVDEYDIHMDPKNRELIAKMLISTVKDAGSQYIVITPSQITFAKEEANIITVQNVEGKSIIREVA